MTGTILDCSTNTDLFGAFVVNPEGEVCFTQSASGFLITQVRLVAGHLVVLVTDDGQVRLMPDEIDARIVSALRRTGSIMIALFNDGGALSQEYYAPVSVTE